MPEELTSGSSKVTATLLSFRRRIGRLLVPRRGGVIDLARIAQTSIATVPFNWAAIDRLFSTEDAAALAATFRAITSRFCRATMVKSLIATKHDPSSRWAGHQRAIRRN